MIRGYFRKKRFEKEKFLRDIKNLQERKLIDCKELPNGKLKIILTGKGKEKILEYSIDDIRLDIKKHWDGRWRMIIFDIPESKKKARDALREKLTQLRFYQVQESVYLTPYECEREIDFICSVFDIRRYVLIFYISHFEGEEKIRYYFKV